MSNLNKKKLLEKAIGKGGMKSYFTKSHKKLSKKYIELCNKFLDEICWPTYYCGDVTSDGKNNIAYNVYRFRKRYRNFTTLGGK